MVQFPLVGCIISALLLIAALDEVVSERPPHQQTIYAITHVTVIDMTGGPPLPDMTVLVLGQRITAVSPSARTKVPAGARVLRGRGKFLIPGLWDMHVHALREGRANSYFPMFIANGVTGVRDMGTFLDSMLFWRHEIGHTGRLAPRLVAAGPILDGQNSAWSFALRIATAEEGRRAVDSLKAAGVDFIKVYSLLPHDAYFAIAEESRRLGIPFAGHVPQSVTLKEASEAGQRSIEHLNGALEACVNPDSLTARLAPLPAGDTTAAGQRTAARVRRRAYLDLYDDQRCALLYEEFVRQDTWQVPTLVTLRSFAFLTDSAFTADDRIRYVPASVRQRWTPARDFRLSGRTDEDFKEVRQTYALRLQLVGKMERAGIPLLAGTDVSWANPYTFAGFSLHDELSLLVEGGLTPYQALQTATVNPARFLHATDSLGTVELGKLADLVVLDADPLQDIRNTRKVHAVFLNGQLIDSSARQALLARAAAAVIAVTVDSTIR